MSETDCLTVKSLMYALPSNEYIFVALTTEPVSDTCVLLRSVRFVLTAGFKQKGGGSRNPTKKGLSSTADFSDANIP